MCKSNFIEEIKARKEELEAISDMTIADAIEKQIAQDEYFLKKERFTLGRKKSEYEKSLEIQKHKHTLAAYNLMIDGLSVDEIANALSLSKTTVYRHLRNASGYLVNLNSLRGHLVNVARSYNAMFKI